MRHALTTASRNLPELGAELQKILTEPQAHSIGEAAAVLERLYAELQLMRAHSDATAWLDARYNDPLQDLFDESLTENPLTADDVHALAGMLQG